MLAALADLEAGDRDWRVGRVCSLVYSAAEWVDELVPDLAGAVAAVGGGTAGNGSTTSAALGSAR